MKGSDLGKYTSSSHKQTLMREVNKVSKFYSPPATVLDAGKQQLVRLIASITVAGVTTPLASYESSLNQLFFIRMLLF